LLHFVRNDIERLPRWFDVFRNDIGPQASGKGTGGVRDDIGPQTSGKDTGGVGLGKNLKEVGSQEREYVQYFAGGAEAENS